jgi:hypothetical protein
MNPLTINEQRLVLETKIAERALIIYVDESAIADMEFPSEYTKALQDEIENHNTAISEYQEELKKLNS